LARRIAKEQENVYHLNHALEHALNQASLGKNFLIFTEKKLFPILEKKIRDFNSKLGTYIQLKSLDIEDNRILDLI
jgi:hypothetical protein